MAFLSIQTKQNSNGSASSLVITPTAPLTVGNLVVVSIKTFPARTISSVVDSAGNTYALAGTRTSSGGVKSDQYYGVQVVGGATTVTASVSGGATAIRATIDEFSGGKQTNAQVFDRAATNVGTGTSGSVTIAPISAGELVSAMIAPDSTTTSITPGTNYTAGTLFGTQSTFYRLSGTISETAPITWTNSVAWAEIASAYIPLGGDGSLKKISGVLRAGVKKINGVVYAAIKKIGKIIS